MKTKFYMIALAAMTMMLGSCSDSNSEFSQDYLADTPIKLNVSVDEPTTRAGYSDADKPTGFVLSVQHSGNESDKYNYLVWAEGEDKDWKTYDFEWYSHDGTKKDVTMLWANMNDKVTIAALSDVDYMYSIVDKHPTDQTTPDALKKADFLAMPITIEVAPTQSGINVEFKHTMSKINLTIELGSEYEFTEDDVDKKITDVKIDGSKVKANYVILSSIVNPQFNFYGQSDGPTPITPLHTGATPFSKDADGVITKASATYEAILIPQTIASGKFTVSFKVDGKLYEWAYNQELTLDPTTAYTLKLTAGDDKVQPVSFSVAPWGVGNGENGEKKETD